MASVARTIGKRLREEGIQYVFGLPGGEVLDLLQGFRQERLRFILTRHETAAAFMADAHGYLSGKPGVCVATLGPGATNLVTGVTHAFLDRSPVIAISGQLPVDRLTAATHQAIGLLDVFRPITKWVQRVSSGNAAEVADKAVMIASEERPGPVYLEIPSDVPRQEFAGMVWPRPAVRAETIGTGKAGADKTGVSAAAFDQAIQAIAGARKPLILAGLGVKRHGAHRELIALAERLQVPVIVTPKAKGTMPEDHDLFIGTIEMLGTGYLYDLIQSSDLLIAVGFDAVELDRPWPAAIPMVHIDVIPNVDRYFPSTWDLVGPIGQILKDVGAALGFRSLWGAGAVRESRERLFEIATKTLGGLCPHQVLESIREVAPRETILATDVGAHKMATGQFWKAYEPGRFMMSNGLSSMGYGVPAALAAKLLNPDCPVMAVVGDGGFAMVMAELETAVREELPVVITVMSDETLSLIKMGHERRGYDPFGVDFNRLDYVSLAAGLGAKGIILENQADCRDVYREALQSKVPVLVEARINAMAYRI